jgi:hypothetical protein
MDNVLPEGSVELTPGAQLAGSLQVGAAPQVGKLEFKAAQSAVIELADGRKIGMAVPKGSLSLAIAVILADFKNPIVYDFERVRVKALLYVTDIDGVPEPRIGDSISRAALEEKIGDQFLDGLVLAWAEAFPPMEAKSISAVKKS